MSIDLEVFSNFLDEGPIELMHQSYECLSKQNFDHTNYWYLISVVKISEFLSGPNTEDPHLSNRL